MSLRMSRVHFFPRTPKLVLIGQFLKATVGRIGSSACRLLKSIALYSRFLAYLSSIVCIVAGMSGQQSRRPRRPVQKKTAAKFGVIKQAVVLDARPSEVFEAYVDPRKHTEFTGTATTGEPRVGGKFTAGDGYITGKYIKLEPGKKILHEWTTTEWPAGYPPSILELTLKPNGAKTKLTMVHSKVPAGQVEYYAKGWEEYYWGPLKKYFEKASQAAMK